MLVDGFTVLAQMVNFLILIWLLERFLYRPVLAAIEARESLVAAQLAEAATRQSEANSVREALLRHQQVLDEQSDELLQKARVEAAAERKRLLDAATDEAHSARARLDAAAAAQRQQWSQQLAVRVQMEVLATTRSMLTGLAGISLEARMIETFTEHLRGAATGLAANRTHRALIQTAFELTAQQRQRLETTVSTCIPGVQAVQFEVVPRLVCGIELTLDGQKIAWSLGDTLARLSTSLLADATGQEAQ